MNNRVIYVDKATYDKLNRLTDSRWREDDDGQFWQLFKSKKDPMVVCIRKAINGEVVLIKSKE